MPASDSPVHRYHDGTKHHFTRFSRSLGYLDWATQPRPYRAFDGAPAFTLFPAPLALPPDQPAPAVTYDRLFGGGVPPQPLTAAAIGDLLRHALGLSAWKSLGEARWSLRVNPSSGNLHPTEAYVACRRLEGLAASAGVYHYAADRHALELRCAVDADGWRERCGDAVILVALTSIHWRESWKYGERAFRYCQHDLGHAVAALSLSAAMLGWETALLPSWSHRQVAALTGIDRDEDFIDAEREEPGCLLAMAACGGDLARLESAGSLVDLVGRGAWSGRASQLSDDHIEWTFIDEIARATADPGRAVSPRADGARLSAPTLDRPADARALVLQRRSAVSFDGRSSLDATSFFALLFRVMPQACAPWHTLWWTPRLHLLLFVHRVDGLSPGLYLLGREEGSTARLRAAIGRDVLWESVHESLPLVCLARGDCRSMARRLSCDQDIASDGFFSLGMLAEFDGSLAEHGPAFYRHLFWESGAIGQVLYLEAEAAGARATGIGCFYDDPVHEVLGLDGHGFQSLYHFAVGAPVDDARLTSAAGYGWEAWRDPHTSRAAPA